jgi:hypothetical protein
MERAEEMVISNIAVRATTVACVLAWAVLAGAAGAEAYKAPRNAFHQPDFSGVWTNASLTQLERPPQVKSLVITEAQARVGLRAKRSERPGADQGQ